MQKWEYCVLVEQMELNPKNIEDVKISLYMEGNKIGEDEKIFAKLGAEGWELATAVPYNLPTALKIVITTTCIYTFKRPIE